MIILASILYNIETNVNSLLYIDFSMTFIFLVLCENLYLYNESFSLLGINTTEHVEDSQYKAVVNLCLELKINYSTLLTSDVKSHSEFMKAAAHIASSSQEYHRLLNLWRSHQSFVKKNLKYVLL